jgi:preprotein translocase subunit SecF
LVLIPGIISLAQFGLRPSIDFTGGALLEYRFQKSIDKDQAKGVLEEAGFQVNSVQTSGENTYLFRLAPINKDEAATVKTILAEKFEEVPEEIRFETVGPTLGRELLTKTIFAIILAAGAILSYVAWRFKNLKFGVCAILAMFHDSFILLASWLFLWGRGGHLVCHCGFDHSFFFGS